MSQLTREQAEAFVKELDALCEKHGVRIQPADHKRLMVSDGTGRLLVEGEWPAPGYWTWPVPGYWTFR
jgi:hypothetical protein